MLTWFSVLSLHDSNIFNHIQTLVIQKRILCLKSSFVCEENGYSTSIVAHRGALPLWGLQKTVFQWKCLWSASHTLSRLELRASRQKLLVVSLKVERKDWDNLKNRGDSLFVMIQFSCLEFRVIGYHDTFQFLWATGGQGNHVPCGHACHPHNPFWLALSGSVSVIKLIHDTSSDAHNSIYRTKRIVCRCL